MVFFIRTPRARSKGQLLFDRLNVLEALSLDDEEKSLELLTGTLTLRRFWEQVKRSIWPLNWGWMTFLAIYPLVLSSAVFFSWPDGTPGPLIAAELCYSVLLIFFLIKRVFRNPLAELLPLLMLFVSVSLSVDSGGFVNHLGFKFYIYPKSSFFEKRCRTTSFFEDHKPYEVGLCDIKLDQSGQFEDFSFMYDTSGNASIDEDAKETRNLKDRKEWVDAIRKFMRDDPNDQFEYTYFYSERLYGDFYSISFEPGVSLGGFTQEYGPPPYNIHNPYQPIF